VKRPPAVALAVAVAVLALVASGCGTVGGGHTVTVGAVYPLSGTQGPGGVEEARGAQVAVELANRDGGAKGRKIRLKMVDVDVGSAAPQAMRDLHAGGVDLVIGTYGSTISAPAAEVAAQDGMLLWETGAVGQMTAPGAGQSFFRVAPQGGHLGRGAVDFVRDQVAPMLGHPGPLRWAVAYVDDLYGRAVGEGAVAEAQAAGGALAGAFPYDVNRFDPAELVGRIAASRPDVLFVSAYLDDGVAIRKATIDAHLPLLASIGTSSSYCMRAFAAKLGGGAVGLFASDKPDGPQMREDALTPEGRRALAWGRQRYKQRFNDEMTAPALAGFAGAWALVGHVLPASPGFTPARVAATARSLKLATGTLPNGSGLDLAGPGQPGAGENRAAVSVIWQWVAPGVQAVVWPAALATRPLQPVPIQT
jgi:branched-chain amino acid transport system substrate-binding protein